MNVPPNRNPGCATVAYLKILSSLLRPCDYWQVEDASVNSCWCILTTTRIELFCNFWNIACSSVQQIAYYQPRCPVMAITRHANLARQLDFFRGIHFILYDEPPRDEWVSRLGLHSTRMLYLLLPRVL